MNDLYIVDFKSFGNVIRFYLGTADQFKEAHGDDWDDRPYEHNAGTVYDRYITGFIDIGFNGDITVFEPCDGEWNSHWSKFDFKARKCPVIAAAEIPIDDWVLSFKDLLTREKVLRIYMGDTLKELTQKLRDADIGVILKHEEKKH